MTKVNVIHVKKSDTISCGAMVCYYTEKVIYGNIYIFFVLHLHTSEVYLEPGQTSKMKLL